MLALVAGAAFVGLGCGAGFALVREYARPHILSVSQAEAILDAPVVAIFGGSTAKAKKGARPSASADTEAAGLALVNLLGRSGRRRQPDSIVLVSTENDAAARIQAAQLLAGAAFQRGDHVLFVDAARAVVSEGQPGLMNVLAGECSIGDAIDYDTATDIAYMELGERNGTSRGLPRGAATRFLDDAGRRFDLVVVDAGDIRRNTAIGSLLGVADHIVFLVRRAETLQSEAMRCAEAAAVMGSGVTATILFEPGGKPSA